MTEESELRERAANYVLGLADDAERLRAEADMKDDPLFRDAVNRLAGYLSRLDQTAADDAVPAGLWDQISARIADRPQDRPPASRGVTLATAPVRFYAVGWPRAVAIAASLLVFAGLGYVAGHVSAPTQQPVVLVVLETPENVPGAIFEAYADNSVRIVPLENFTVPDGKVMQVWTLYDKAVGPVSLGTISSAEIVTLAGRSLPLPVEEQLYEITLEPVPGSPTGKPTGPILVKGFARQPPS